ncbi:MAG: ATP-binding cassette domain-containing protein [Planctomycetes bacterium]|nr:ATP-binding cassette domain-containing protein [Planctomycetota bacterium]
MSAVIEVRSLTRRFGDLIAVDHVQFEVSEGEVFGFLGPNGAGKTTTVRMLTGVLDPTEGTATIRGHDIRKESLGAREHLGIVPEQANVYLDLSVWRNVMLMAELHGVARARRVKEAERLLGLLGLGERKKQKARALSKGLRQRLMLCSALVSGPEILFLDEPTSGLDVQSARLIRQIVRDLNRDGLTVFLTTHNMAEAEEICDRVAIIHKGHIAAIDTPDQLRQILAANQYVEVTFEGRGPQDAELLGLPDMQRVARLGERLLLYTPHPGRTAVALAGLADRDGLQVRDLSTRKPSLEDVFLFLTQRDGQEATP